MTRKMSGLRKSVTQRGVEVRGIKHRGAKNAARDQTDHRLRVEDRTTIGG